MKRSIFYQVKSINFFASLFLLTVFFTGCVKEDHKKDPNALLTGKNWIITAETINPPLNFNGTLITDWYAQRSSCSKDNLTRFETDGTYIYDQGSEKCSPDIAQTSSGRWVWNPEKTKITITESSNSYTYNVVELTGSKMVYTETIEYLGINYTVTTTMAKR
jgi:hypothetical protein